MVNMLNLNLSPAIFFPFDEGEIHVKTEYGYGVFKSPEYIFEEISSTGKKTFNDNPYTIKQALEDILP